jgi:hypothetical protein
MYWIDTYFLFKKDLKDLKMEDKNEDFDEYHFKDIRSIEDNYFKSLLNLWTHAYNVTQDTSELELHNLFQDGDICHGLIYGDNVVGMTWSGQKKAIRRIDFANVLKNEKSAWIGHHDFISENHRGKGFQKSLSLIRMKNAKNKGCHYYYVFVGVKNFASIRNLMKVFPEYKLIFHIKIDVPLFSFNVFPGHRKEGWVAC